MKPLHFSFSAFLVAALPIAAFAQTIGSVQPFPYEDVSVGAYTDSPWDQTTNVAVSALTRMGVIQGNDDGTFAPDRRLNRAEFVTIVMRLLSDHDPVSLNCFPDVSANAWYAEDVCRAKSLGLIRGNAVAGVPSSQWRFEPSRDIQYEEAVKILVELYALPTIGDTEGSDWYVPYLHAAEKADVDISSLGAGSHITRGEMARLTIAFVAESQGRLNELRDAERGSSSSSSRSSSSRSSSSSSKSSSSSSSSSSSKSSSSSSRSSVVGETVMSHIVVLGTTSPTLASTDLFSNSEPVDVDGITVTFTAPVPSIGSLLIYDQDGIQIGTATAVSGSNTQFHASIAFGKLLLPYREERMVSVKARLKSKDTGGVSGENIRVQNIAIEGEGRWTNEAYNSDSSETFPESETAFAKITGFTNAGANEGVATSGLGRVLADFVVHADTPEAQHQISLEDLEFTIEQAGGVTLSNVSIRNEDGSATSPCTVFTTTVTCLNIDAGVGTVDESRRIKLIGDVTIPGNANNPSLRLVLNDPGTPANAGDITWSDQSTTFMWVDLDQPVFGGTMWR